MSEKILLIHDNEKQEDLERLLKVLNVHAEILDEFVILTLSQVRFSNITEFNKVIFLNSSYYDYIPELSSYLGLPEFEFSTSVLFDKEFNVCYCNINLSIEQIFDVKFKRKFWNVIKTFKEQLSNLKVKEKIQEPVKVIEEITLEVNKETIDIPVIPESSNVNNVLDLSYLNNLNSSDIDKIETGLTLLLEGIVGIKKQLKGN